MAVVRELSKSFKLKEVLYDQICRSGDYAIYSLRYTCDASRIIGHDVVRVTQSTLDAVNALIARRGELGLKIDGDPGDVCESYPPNSSWGTHAWSYTSLEEATKKFDELIAA